MIPTQPRTMLAVFDTQRQRLERRVVRRITHEVFVALDGTETRAGMEEMIESFRTAPDGAIRNYAVPADLPAPEAA